MKVRNIKEILDTTLKGIGLAMGVCVVVLSLLGKVEVNVLLTMLGFGLAALSMSLLNDN